MSELKIIGRHTATVLVGQLAVMAFGVTDTIVAGRYSAQTLAALSVGSAIYISVFVGLMGVLQALLPVWAELHGARRLLEVGRSFRQALFLCLITVVLGMGLLLWSEPLLRWTDVPLDLHAEVKAYLAVLALALPPSLLFRMFSTLNQSLGRPLLVTWLQIGSLLVKVPLSIWFVFGGWGLSPQGAVGCAWATLVVNYLMLGWALFLLRNQALYRPYRIWSPLERPNWSAIASFARLGLPGGLAIMVEVTSFTLMALFIARLGTVASASHQIAANLTALCYMTPLAIAIAASSRVSFWLGAEQADKARSAIRLGLQMSLVAGLSLSLIMLLAGPTLAGIYSSNLEVVALATTLLSWVALYLVADSIQVVCVFFLRCFKVTLLPLLVYCLLLWGLGLAGGYLLAYQDMGLGAAWQTATAFWASSAVALWLTAVIFLLLLWQVLSVQKTKGWPR